MTPVPFDMPVRPAEAADLANLIFDHGEGKPLNDDLRNRLSARAATVRRVSVTPYFGSLERDPVHPSTYYLAVDGLDGVPLLLHITYSTAPSSGLYPKSVLVGRMRRTNGPEIVVNYVPFGPADGPNVAKFATRLNSAFLPHPQAARPAIAVRGASPEVVLAGAFDAYRTILKRTGLNLASTAGHTYHAGLWAAIRAGWREGYTAEAERIVVSAGSLEPAKETIRNAAGFTKFSTDTSSLFAPDAAASSDAAVEERFERIFDAEERSWMLDEFARAFTTGEGDYEFAVPEIMRLAVQFGASLKANEALYEYIRETRAPLKARRSFDFEPSLEGAAAPTTAKELIFYLQWLRARGCPAQLIAPEWQAGRPAPLKELAAVARHFQGILSLQLSGGETAELLEAVGKATVGKVNYRVEPREATRAEIASHINWVAENLIA